MSRPSLSFPLSNDLETCGKKLSCTLSDNHAWVSNGHKDFVKDEVDVRMKVDRAVSGELFQDKHTGVPAGLLLVPLQQANGSRNFIVHEMLSKSCATNLRDLSECLGGSKHDVEVTVRQKRLDIIVEAEKIVLELDRLFAIDVKEVV